VCDNLKTGVDRPDLYDPQLNRSFGELAEHYGVLIDPARSRKPRDKPRVERPMPYVRDSFWRGREFTSLAAMQTEALRWCDEVAGTRACRPLDGAGPGTVFAAVEQPALLALPPTAFELACWSRPKVGPDIHIKVGKTLYSVPWRLIGQHVDARATATTVRVFHEGTLVKTHIAKPRGKQTDNADYPPEKIAFHMRTPVWCREQAAEIGQVCTAVVAELLEVNALFRLRAAQGVLGLADKHGAARLEAACALAVSVGDPSYRTIKGILAAGTEHQPVAHAARAAGDGGAAAHLHGPERLWLHAGESVILTGAVGVGKTFVAQALGHLAIRRGADVRFTKTSRVLAELAGGHADHSWTRRLRELARPALLILDDFGMRELSAAQADDLYELITERTGRSLVLTSNRSPTDWYPLFPNPVVAESLLDRLINTSHQVLMDGPSYRPNKRPGPPAPTGEGGHRVEHHHGPGPGE